MTAASPELVGDDTSPWWANSKIAMGVALAAGAVAIVICVNQLRVPHAFLGVDEYDDGVDLGAAIRLAHGSIPYRDFLFGHPPGVPLLMTPLALIGRLTGTRILMAIVRIVTMFVTAGCVILVARLVRHRGVHAVILAGVLVAIFPMAVTADKTLLLEPYLDLFCLVGAALMFVGDEPACTRNLTLAGIAFGFAAAIKLWAVLPAFIALACCLPSVRRKVRPALLGMAAGFLTPSLPFLLLAPKDFFRDVIAIQLSRGSSVGSLSVSGRLVYITGIQGLTVARPTTRLAEAIVAVVAVAVLAAFLVRPRPTRLDWFALGSAGASVSALLVAPDFHPHYADFSAPFLALLVAISCDRILKAVAGAVGTRADRAGLRRRLVSILVGAVVVATAVGALFGIVQARNFDRANPGYITVGDPGPMIASAVPKGACAVSDEAVLLIAADRFVSSVKCPVLLDPYYLWLLYDRADPPPAAPPYNPRLVAQWQTLFGSVEYVVLSSNPFRIPWTSGLSAYFNQNFQLVISNPDAAVYRRD